MIENGERSRNILNVTKMIENVIKNDRKSRNILVVIKVTKNQEIS